MLCGLFGGYFYAINNTTKYISISFIYHESYLYILLQRQPLGNRELFTSHCSTAFSAQRPKACISLILIFVFAYHSSLPVLPLYPSRNIAFPCPRCCNSFDQKDPFGYDRHARAVHDKESMSFSQRALRSRHLGAARERPHKRLLPHIPLLFVSFSSRIFSFRAII